MAERRHFKGKATATTLATDISSSANSFAIVDATGWPDGSIGRFTVTIGLGTASEETVIVTSRTGTTFFTVERGTNDTTAASHTAGTTVHHTAVRQDFDEANKHITDITVDDHTQYLNNARHDLAARHTIGTVILTGVPLFSAPGASPNEGVATTLARSDHHHGREPLSTTVQNNNIGAAGTPGVNLTAAREDHIHPMVGFGSPAASAVGDTAGDGVATTLIRSDHKHAREGFGAVTAQTDFNQASANGTATTNARSDHTHGTPNFDAKTATNTGTVSTSSTSWTDLSGPDVDSVTVGSSGMMLVIVGAAANSAGAFAALMAFELTGANARAANDVDAHSVNGPDNMRGCRATLVTGLVAGVTNVKPRYRSNDGATAASFSDRSVIAIPL